MFGGVPKELRLLHLIGLRVEEAFDTAGIITDKEVMWEHPLMIGWALSYENHIPIVMAFKDEPPELDQIEARLIKVLSQQYGWSTEDFEVKRMFTKTKLRSGESEWTVITGRGYRLQSMIFEMEISDRDWSKHLVFVDVEKLERE